MLRIRTWGAYMGASIRKVIYWIVILILGIFIHSLRLELIGGIQIVFIGLFTCTLIQKHQVRSIVMILTFVHMVSVLLFDVPTMDFVFIIEAIFLGVLYKKFKHMGLVIPDLFFWLSIGAFCYGIILKSSIIPYDRSYIYFFILTRIINSVVNVLIFDIMVIEIPYMYDRVFGKKSLRISLNKLLFHMMMVLITIPMLLNIYAVSNRYDGIMMNHFSSYADSLFNRIQQEINQWNSREKQKFQLYDVVQREKIKEIINTKNLKDNISIVITNKQDNILVSTNDEFIIKEEYKLETYENIKVLEKEFYEITLQQEGKLDSYDDNRQASYIIKQCIPTIEIKIYMIINIDRYVLDSMQATLEGLGLLLIFWILIVILITFLNYIIFKGSNRLYEITVHLPENITHIEQVKWTNSCIEEIYMVEKNFRETAFKLKETFERTMKLNEKLKNKSKKLKQSQRQLYDLAYIDALTNLGNRLKLKEDMIKISNQSYHTNKLTAICLLDINQFKKINSTLGHELGDLLLIEIAQRLKSICENQEISVYRLAGDKFVILSQIEDMVKIQKFRKEVADLFNEHFLINKFRIHVDSSVGISIYPYHTNDINTALKYADIAMQESKRLASNTGQIFNRVLKAATMNRIMIEDHVKQIIEERDFLLYYQPKFDLISQRLTGLEALLRWNSKIAGNIETSIFCSIAEKMGVMSDLDEWVIEQVCSQIKVWKQQGKHKVPIVFNISQTFFKQNEFLKKIKDNIKKDEIQVSDIMIKLSEEIPIEDEEKINKIILQLKELGVKVSVGHWGVGHCSFKQFLSLDVEEVRVDAVLVNDINKKGKPQLAMKYMTEMLHELDIRIVAEGIETKEELEYMKYLGCNEGQGIFFCKPVNNREIEKFL